MIVNPPQLTDELVGSKPESDLGGRLVAS